ncbi:MAG: UDP-N-acetylmuramoyl-L-alanyl-D-glutamate--2,6-diaminopimelate ligase [Paenibacillus macerans]|uniref:UDP-N-acetylmuramoyl-L-alanyl-D-glutamate--2,6-diaminopimelate ligase n=1 Tax=Paenibacillus macerans TaxID=44252 RepID=A0A6N8ET99_PAEMA|nr:UDP-N-acetylmuramoyl-L-alanyl-D-glutamate--2,6-diaminopimelate ligase [Paenibacillus macerans]MBS5911639.1 UDP-N-acetylmuramoyl-L-alanyl-D-glutamate--2,6-diaminopimelate ligase [Paenibacillus macerans]MDU7474601.1 UDP-N-acetylmuramoyl-L-alanyl-D-glutamate--2,6-diaminopimelate ligase [Paenibacillus macerans]MEC0141191.1 UDP-N-acetylmuramoyl-L-alanyl-D-glutamate--2,6-diaminopimelate ligase [Paenibacillus macerans]MEC0330351.1 UDP-N-acetylmuramoyl-L-alanyl-D-glutamate--2,6-diaminopimelate ligas
MQLKELATYLIASQIRGDGELACEGIAIDSRKVQPGDLFICLPGHTVDGHDFAPQAADKGAAALVVERWLDDCPLPQLKVKDSRLAMAVLGNVFFGFPSRRLKVIGVTGTNGKTTTTYLIERILEDQGRSTGLIGTIQRKFAGRTYPMSGTTPESLELQRYLHEMAEGGAAYCVMEVSSHALDQGRVKGTHFRTAVFTNLTQDHLDYHNTMEEYRGAKGLFFSRLGNNYPANPDERSYAVLNADDPASSYFAKQTAAETITYGVENEADVRASDISVTAKGTSFHVDTFQGSADISLRMVGKFNVYNALAAIAAALLEGIPLERIKASLEAVKGVEGRVEAVDEGQSFAVIVDYAHTPDGLENVLRTVNEFAKGRVICVFGCGGDRDRTKRPIMGRIAAKYAHHVIVTSDNPRTEDPDAILSDIEQGLIGDGVDRSRYELIVDRREAIQKAIEMASREDVVLIAGKGHETYQLIGTAVLDFDDRIVAKEAIRGLAK